MGLGLDLRKTGEKSELASTQHHFQHGEPKPGADWHHRQYQAEPRFAQKVAPAPPPGLTLYPGYQYNNNAWGMTIDLNACIGCSACMIACQAENNIPVVGKRKWAADGACTGSGGPLFRRRTRRPGDTPPAGAVHAVRKRALRAGLPGGRHHAQRRGAQPDGVQPLRGHTLCSNNCPYKVRRFNFFQFADWSTPA